MSECSPLVMARLYSDVASAFMVHMSEDAATLDAIGQLEMRAIATDILMPDRAERARLAGEALKAMA